MDRDDFSRHTGLTDTDIRLLRSVSLFSKLDDTVMMDLLQDSSVRHYPRNTVLFFQGDPADRFCVIFEGWVKLFRQTADGHESVLHLSGPKDSFAEAAIFDSHDFPVNAEVVYDARILVVPADTFLTRLRSSADICLDMMGALSRRNRFLVQTVEQMSVKSSAERLATFLVGLCLGDTPQCEINLPLDKSLIAGRLNMQPETLSRGFAKLKSVGVTTKGNKVFVEDVGVLRTFAQGESKAVG